MKVTLVPEQMVVEEAAMLTEGVTAGVTVMVIILEVAVAGEAQASEEVITTVTWSPFTRPVFE